MRGYFGGKTIHIVTNKKIIVYIIRKELVWFGLAAKTKADDRASETDDTTL